MLPKTPFLTTITNEETSSLPAAQFDGEIVVVDTDQAVLSACKDLMAQPVIGFDTETRPSFRVGAMNRVALLQLSTPTRCYLFRLCCIRFDKPIIRVLEDKNVLKIGAAVAGDLSALRQLRHFRDGGFVDLQALIGEWGVTEKSLRKMSAVVLGYRVSKAQRLSNWEATHLTPQQQMYAATDAWVCGKIYDRLCHTQKCKIVKKEPHDTTSPSA
ncbi:MAG: 3'-5' exonuclease [Alistipes sp.]